ncbi:hypothetical protein [Pantoea sp. A4]|uniref:hypothetical protein n=1 Tax=Pantoea sp. A4 TaxID=1225184 RepID=UPI000375C525|nr:hypothetical protein [Pantoea sp. A4]
MNTRRINSEAIRYANNSQVPTIFESNLRLANPFNSMAAYLFDLIIERQDIHPKYFENFDGIIEIDSEYSARVFCYLCGENEFKLTYWIFLREDKSALMFLGLLDKEHQMDISAEHDSVTRGIICRYQLYFYMSATTKFVREGSQMIMRGSRFRPIHARILGMREKIVLESMGRQSRIKCE